MKRLLNPCCTLLAIVGLMVGTAMAQTPPKASMGKPMDCPALIKQVRAQVGKRFDKARHAAMDLVKQAEKAYADKKPAECMAKVKEAEKVANLKLQYTQNAK